ncbi:MAG: hypothetical protein IPI58_02830 [Alphaproteobacteria bacterium]|nr:MAG: hypothetical protein IPI58_02830 [Alphaproteobacteria bacterium]
MSLKKRTESNIAESDQDIWKDDWLDSRGIADHLTPMLEKIDQPFVIALNAAYGTGKTFLLRRWQRDLCAKGHKAVYFNAWETDYSDNAFAAFIAAIDQQLRDTIRSKVTDKGKKIWDIVVKESAPLILKGLVRRAIGQEALDSVSDVISISQGDVSDRVESLAKDLLSSQKKMADSIEGFRVALDKYIKILNDGKEDQGTTKKLIIFVDELDRCRPTYAIEILECIKHLFNVDGVVFVLAIDIEQLKATIHKIYGSCDDGEGYLRKFIDWQFNLPKPSTYQFANKLYEDFGMEDLNIHGDRIHYLNNKEPLINSFSMIAQLYNMSLREMAHVFTDIYLCITMLKQEEFIFSYALGIIAPLRHKLTSHEISAYCRGGKYNDLINIIGNNIRDNKEINQRIDIKRTKLYLRAVFMNDADYMKACTETPATSCLDNDNVINYRKLYVGDNALPPRSSYTAASIVLDRLEGLSFIKASDG